MTRPDIDAILPPVSAEDEATVDALLAKAREGVGKRTYTIGETEWAQRIATLEHMLAEERENVDTLRARAAELEARIVVLEAMKP